MSRENRTVLLIDGVHGSADIYEHLLAADATFSYQLIEEPRNPQLLALCEAVQVDGIVLENHLAELDCLEWLNRFQAQFGEACPPVLVVGEADINTAVKALKQGAADYLVKEQLTAESLCLALRTAIENAELKRELQHSQERFQTSIENMMDCFGIYSAMRDESGQIIDFRIDYVNAAACANNHMTREQQIGQGLCEVLPGHRDSGLFEAYCRLVETGEPVIKDTVIFDDTYGGEQRLVRAFDIRATKLKDGFVASWRDVTDRRRTEITLQEKVEESEAGRQTLEALMEYLPEGIVIADAPDGQIRHVSRYGQQVSGRPLEQLTGVAIAHYAEAWGLFCADGLTPATGEDLPLARAIQQGEVVVDEEWVLQRPDGQQHILACNAGPIYNADGQITGGIIAWHDISHRKQLETDLQQTAHSLHQKQDSLTQLIDQAPIGIGIASASGNVKLINDAMLQIHGYTRAEFERQGLNWWDFVPPEEVDQATQAMAQLREQGSIPPVERELQRRDGTRVPIWLGATQWVEEAGDHVAFALDLTQQKQTEAALKKSEANLWRVLDTLYSFVGILRPDGTLLEINQIALEAANLKAEDVIGKPFDQTYWWAYSAAVQTQLREAIARAATGETSRYEVQVRLGPNRWITIDFALVPIWDDQGQVEYLIPSGVDITQRVTVEASLRESQAQLQQQLAEIELIYQTAPIGLNVLDRDLRFLRINELLAEVNGLPVEAHLGRTVGEILPNLAEAAERLLRPIFDTGEPVLNVEIEGETPAMPGIKRTWRESFWPLKEGDQVIGVSTFCEEITDRKQAEREREQLLQQERAARQEAEEANRVKDEFLAILSHELRSPLNPILGWARLLQTRQWSAEKTAQALATIERNAELQTKLIDDLLDVARILRGKLKLDFRRVSLVAVIEAAIETVQSTAQAKAIALHVDMPEVGQVQGDAARLQQIVWNLLTNAIKFTPTNGQVSVRLAANSETVQIIITDTGIGIPPEFLPHIFESFRQKDTSVTRQFGGLGLGLSIVRYLVEAHGGTITADSAGEGQGSTFTVSLPFLQTTGNAQPSPPTALGETDLTGVRIMAIDDHPDSLELVSEFLMLQGAEVTQFASTREALAALPHASPDIVVSDIGMPDMDGYELIRQIRALPAERGGQVPAIALTAYAREVDCQKALASGYQKHLPKPIEGPALVQAVAELVRASTER